MDKGDIESRISRLIQQYGEWTYDIPLKHGIWTKGNLNLPHTRLKRVLQIVQDMSEKPINTCKILDLGCLDGIYSIELALHGASVIGVDIREANIKKAIFAKECLGLNNIEFIQDDVRNLSLQKYGRYDVILCIGILYHLNNPEVFTFIENMYKMLGDLLIIDTHISLNPTTSILYKGKDYHGHIYREHDELENNETKLKRLWSSYGNDTSFWFTRPSLINFLSHTGFSSIYECFNPPHLNFGKPGLEHKDRCTLVAIKGQRVKLHTTPAANNINEDWPQESLAYTYQSLKNNNLSVRQSRCFWRTITQLWKKTIKNS